MAQEQKIGEIVLDSEFMSSKFADKHLFFKHGDMLQDLEDHNEWIEYTPVWRFFGLDLSNNK